jgi:hypothetical protein
MVPDRQEIERINAEQTAVRREMYRTVLAKRNPRLLPLIDSISLLSEEQELDMATALGEEQLEVFQSGDDPYGGLLSGLISQILNSPLANRDNLSLSRIDVQAGLSFRQRQRRVGVAVAGTWNPNTEKVAELGSALLYAHFLWRQFTNFGSTTVQPEPDTQGLRRVSEAIRPFLTAPEHAVAIADTLQQRDNHTGWRLEAFHQRDTLFIASLQYRIEMPFRVDLTRAGAEECAAPAAAHFLAWLVRERRDNTAVIGRLLRVTERIAAYADARGDNMEYPRQLFIPRVVVGQVFRNT